MVKNFENIFKKKTVKKKVLWRKNWFKVVGKFVSQWVRKLSGKYSLELQNLLDKSEHQSPTKLTVQHLLNRHTKINMPSCNEISFPIKDRRLTLNGQNRASHPPSIVPFDKCFE